MTEERGVIPKSVLEKIITGIMMFWVLFPVVCIIGVNTDVLLHPLLVDVTQYLGYILLLLSFLIFMKSNKKIEVKRDLPYLFLLAMLGWIFISAVFSTNRQIAFFGSEARREGALMFLAYAGFFCGALSLSKDKYKKIVFNSFLGVAVFQAICCFLRYFGVNIYTVGYIDYGMFGYPASPWTGVYNGKAHFGYYLVMAIIYAGYNFLLNKGKCKYLYILSYIVLVATLIFTNTVGCFIAVIATLIIGTILLYIKDKKVLVKSIILIVILIIVAVLISLIANEGIFSSEIQNNNENLLWVGSLQFIGERPFVGYGSDNLFNEYKRIGISSAKPYNEYLQYMAECGIPTLIFYLIALAIVFVRRIKNLNNLSNFQLVSLPWS